MNEMAFLKVNCEANYSCSRIKDHRAEGEALVGGASSHSNVVDVRQNTCACVTHSRRPTKFIKIIPGGVVR